MAYIFWPKKGPQNLDRLPLPKKVEDKKLKTSLISSILVDCWFSPVTIRSSKYLFGHHLRLATNSPF